MIYPSPDQLDQAGSKYALVIVAAKRARQIKDGAPAYVKSSSSNPLTVALEELAEGAIVPLQVGGVEKIPDPLSRGPVLHGFVAGLGADDLGHSEVVRAILTPDEEEQSDDLELAEIGADEEEEVLALDEEHVVAAGLRGMPPLDVLGDDGADASDVGDDEDDAGDLDDIEIADDHEVSLDEVAEAEEAGAEDETEE